MSAPIVSKSIRDRWIGIGIAAVGLSLWFLVAMIVYRDIDLAIYTDLPEGVRQLMGIPRGADAASLAYNIMFGSAAPLILAGFAISMGSAAIAGEERNGTLGLLLANPKSRNHVLISKATSMLLLILAAVTILWGVAYAAPGLLGIEIGDTHVGPMMLHLGVNTMFYGFVALAVAAWTGNQSLSSAVAAWVMIVSYFAVGLLPLVESFAAATMAFPWYYFEASEPLINGTNWVHLAVLLAGCALLGATATIGLNRRDLRSQSVSVTILDRLRANPKTRQLFDRLAGSTRVSRLWIKTTSDHQGLLLVTSLVMFSMMGVLLGPMYAAIDDRIAVVADQFPEEIMALAGGGDMSTPEGWFQVETFSLMAPIAIMIVTIIIAARGLAGEEANHTMGLLLSNPIKRSRIVIEQSFAMAIHASVVGLATFAGVAIASQISALNMSLIGIGATSLLVVLLGLMFGALALTISAATGRVKIAVYGTTGVAITSHLLYSFLPLNEDLARYAKWTPNYYYLSSDPLMNGMHWGHAAILASLTAALVGAAVVLFEHRDLRQG